MRFWLRELAGWILVGLGLFVFYICFAVLLSDRPMILSSGPLVLIGIIIFRGGIHLLKVAVAARVCLHADTLVHDRDGAPERMKARRRPISLHDSPAP